MQGALELLDEHRLPLLQPLHPRPGRHTSAGRHHKLRRHPRRNGPLPGGGLHSRQDGAGEACRLRDLPLRPQPRIVHIGVGLEGRRRGPVPQPALPLLLPSHERVTGGLPTPRSKGQRLRNDHGDTQRCTHHRPLRGRVGHRGLRRRRCRDDSCASSGAWRFSQGS
jgi:hypothetical protein